MKGPRTSWGLRDPDSSACDRKTEKEQETRRVGERVWGNERNWELEAMYAGGTKAVDHKTRPHEDYKMTGNARTRESTSQQATVNRKGAKGEGAGSCADNHLSSNTTRPPGRLHDLFTVQA
ncbi:hypothetical protein AB1N83_004719 [Pleurotus pulmonarius]